MPADLITPVGQDRQILTCFTGVEGEPELQRAILQILLRIFTMSKRLVPGHPDTLSDIWYQS